MYKEEINRVALSAKIKSDYLNESIVKYFLLAVMSGFFIIIGIALAFSTAGIINVDGKLYGKIAVGLTFPIALGLLYFAGGELFTGNCFVLSVGLLEKTIDLKKAVQLLLASYLGNLTGSIVLAFIYVRSRAPMGLADHYIEKVAESKLTIPAGELFLRAVLCNFVVCLAIWLCYKMKEEMAKLFMLFWCVFAFATPGFEHSIANMGIFAISLMLPHAESLTITGAVHNLAWVTFGNIIGGSIFLALPYWFVSKGRKSEMMV
ncbi:formate/nitrite transporter family protein [Paenibacillus sp. BAC0078]